MEDELGQHAMEVADKSRIRGIEIVLTIVPNSPQVGGVKSVSKTGKERPTVNVGTETCL